MTSTTTNPAGEPVSDPAANTGTEPKQVRSFRELMLPPELSERDGCPFVPPSGLLRLGGEGPVHTVTRRDGEKIWLVTGHAEARAVLSDKRMSSDSTRSERRMAQLPEKLREALSDRRNRAGSFIGMDAPEHTRYRRLLTGAFTVRRMRNLEPGITRIVNEHLDAMVAAGPSADLVPGFALPVPSLVICELLGVDYADRAEFQHRTSRVLRLDTPLEEVSEGFEEIRDFLRGLVRAKRVEPGDDLISDLIRADPDHPLDDDELSGMANLLLVAGHETTANMLGLGTFALLENPDQLAALRDRPELVTTAVEELLRYLTIIHFGVQRIPLEDVEIGGQLIPADATVVVSAQAANFDGEHFADPERLDLSRPRSPHLAFGHGIHQCLGQQLARVEMGIGFTELLRRLPGLRLDIDPAEVSVRTDMLIYGVHALPVAWDAEAARAVPPAPVAETV
ncbi:cytochrome P450 [Actinokineospora enzanensis]|uniref:cytochrome P450 n=1 Tax=Actinokineospora enzanensis TaxID=155975 RepID=UPI00036A9CA4|nr:cytochrome P450 [Actinokineospora enzanensis]